MISQDLSNRAVLSAIKIGGWSGKKKNRRVSEKAASDAGAANDAVDAYVNLVPKAVLKPLHAAQMAVRQAHASTTLPWFGSAVRLLPLAQLEHHRDAMRSAISGYNRAVESFLQEYERARQDAQYRLGNLYDPSKYPDTDELRGRLQVKHVIEALSMPEDVDRLIPGHADLVEETRAVLEESLRGAFEEALDRVRETVERLDGYARGEKQRLHSSTVEAARGLGGFVRSVATIAPAGVREKYEALASVLDDYGLVSAEEIKHTEAAREHVRDVTSRVEDKLKDIDAALGL